MSSSYQALRHSMRRLYDMLGTDGDAVTDSKVSVLGAIGANNADNAFDSTLVVANANGSVLERLATIQAQAGASVATVDGTANAVPGDVIGNKTDAAVTAVGTTKSIEAYVKGLITMETVQAADSTNNAFAGDVIGNKTDAAVQTKGTTKSLMGYAKGLVDALTSAAGFATFPSSAVPANGVNLAQVIREIYDQEERSAVKAAATLVNGATLFTIAGGSIEIENLFLYQLTVNDATASTVQFSSTPTLGSAKAISAASASLANSAAGSALFLNPTSLATAPDLVTAANGGVAIQPNVANRIIVHPGTLTIIVGTGSTTGTWEAHIRYKPLARGVSVS